MTVSSANKAGIVVVGGGQAAAQLIETLRYEGYAGGITLVGDEPGLPYQRPPLSKQYLAGARAPDWLLYRPSAFYARHGVDTLLGVAASAIDRAARRITLADGRTIAYDQLAIATGCRVRKLSVPGAEVCDVGGVHYLRTIADVDRIRARLTTARRVVIIGGGFIGLEVAAMLVQLGHTVTVLEAQDRVLPRVVAPLVAEFFSHQHQRHGVRIVTGAHVVELRVGPEQTREIVCADGERHLADLLIVGIGVLPNVELAQAAGLACDRASGGIIVDEYARSSDAHIVAAGDCASQPHPRSGGHMRLETVHNAVEQARTAATTLCGKEVPYRQAPWVWSDQYALRLQAVGMIEGADTEVLRGDPATGKFSLFYFQDERLLAAHCVNRSADFAATRRLLNEDIALTHAQAADATFELSQLLPARVRLRFDQPWPPRSRSAMTNNL